MTSSAPRTRLKYVITSAAIAAALCGASAAPALAAPAPAASASAFAAPSTVEAATAALAAHPWETTGAVDENGQTVALDDPRAVNFVGNAYFKADGTYTMYNLDDSPKLQGDWEMRIVDGQLVRWINAKNTAGDVLWERIVPIIQLDESTFTYRVTGQDGAYVDIIHTTTDHAEPTPGAGEGDQGENDDDQGENDDDQGDGNGQSGNGNSQGGNGNGNGNGNGQGDKDNGANAQSTGAQADALATTGGDAPVAAIVTGILAMLSGLGLLVGRFLRGRLS